MRPQTRKVRWGITSVRGSSRVLAERVVQFAELILLGLSEGTVRTHLEHIYRRLHVSSRAAAITRAFSDWDA